MNKAKANRLFQKLAKAIPSPKTELNYTTPFELLVAVILSAQATDVSVNIATEKLFALANTPERFLSLGEDRLSACIKNIGLYKAKSNYLLKTSKILIEKHNSQVPSTREELEALPGVGRKTANIILNIIFNKPTIGVDTHVFRVCNRTKLAPGKTPLEVENRLLKIVPQSHIKDAHHLLILHGRYTCVARKPKCQKCSIYDLCEFEDK